MDIYTPIAHSVMRLPRWAGVTAIVICSVLISIAATVSAVDHNAMSATAVRTSWIITICVPIIVAWPVGLLFVTLIKNLEVARAEATRLANTDLLTGVLNRRRFVQVATEELTQARETNSSVTVLLLDVDDFKKVNDVHGHNTGDAVLKMVAQRCNDALRPEDSFARWGGEEFVAVLPGATDAESIGVALKVRSSISSGEVDSAGELIRVTASIGVAAELEANESLDSLISRADHAMYKAKRSGKNKAILAERAVSKAATPHQDIRSGIQTPQLQLKKSA